MKEGTRYAVRLKEEYAKLRRTVGSPEVPELDEPLLRLGYATLGLTWGEEEAARAIDRALNTLVDWNEMRVSTPLQVLEATRYPLKDGRDRCATLIRVLQSVYNCENEMSLSRLRGMPRREAKHYLEQLNGSDPYIVASVVLWGLGGHAIPVNDRFLSALREADVVHPTADRAEVQSFLERHVSATDAKEFCLITRSLIAERGAGKKGAVKAKPMAASKSSRVAASASRKQTKTKSADAKKGASKRKSA